MYRNMKCRRCHHEWQSVTGDPEICGWCGAVGTEITGSEADRMIFRAERCAKYVYRNGRLEVTDGED